MKIIIPMAGRGSRLRPHTLTVPKPLVPVAGKPVVQRLVEDLAKAFEGTIEEVAYIIGDFGEQVEKDLIQIAESVGAKGSIYHQDAPLGTGHAILCARESLEGNCIIAFADTLFKASFTVDPSKDGIIWVKKVDNPSSFGVIEINEGGWISNFVEKPKEFVSDLAIVGIYYINNGEQLRDELQYLIDNDIRERGEYQLTNALENLRAKGIKFFPAEIEEWLDCGNKDAVVYANQRMLEINKGTKLVASSAKLINSIVIEPCYLGENVVLENTVVGPHVSIGEGTVISDSVIQNSVIQSETNIRNVVLSNSMIGNHVEYSEKKGEISIGDYSKL